MTCTRALLAKSTVMYLKQYRSAVEILAMTVETYMVVYLYFQLSARYDTAAEMLKLIGRSLVGCRGVLRG
jgi:hypothetical protein